MGNVIVGSDRVSGLPKKHSLEVGELKFKPKLSHAPGCLKTGLGGRSCVFPIRHQYPVPFLAS